MSFKAWLSVVTLALVAIIIFFSRHELQHAWQLLHRVNLWILLLLIPGQIIVYYIGGEMMFSYLRAKKAIDHIPATDLTRMALEMNFVNHVLPSGGVSGISYMTWRLGKYGISPGRSTMAQLVRFAMSFIAYVVLLFVAVFVVTIDGGINRWIISLSSAFVLVAFVGGVGVIYLVNSRNRMVSFSNWLVKTVNQWAKKVTFGRKKEVLERDKLESFFNDIHLDYMALRRDKRILVRPFIWGLLYVIGDVLLYMITFWSMGQVVNPAPVLIGYGVAGMASVLAITPGGAGIFEAVMIAFLALAGLNKGEAIAGIVLTRVILLLGTIIFGYLFYQGSLIKYGKFQDTTLQRK